MTIEQTIFFILVMGVFFIINMILNQQLNKLLKNKWYNGLTATLVFSIIPLFNFYATYSIISSINRVNKVKEDK